MIEFLADRPPWLLAGALLALLVVGLLWTIDERLGVSGGLAELAEKAAHRDPALGWRSWFVIGVLGGGLLFGVLGGWRAGVGYGWLAEHGSAATAAALLGGGALIGYGTRTAGGCTSGHGISGTAFGSLASFVSTAVFMGTAVAAAFILRAVV